MWRCRGAEVLLVSLEGSLEGEGGNLPLVNQKLDTKSVAHLTQKRIADLETKAYNTLALETKAYNTLPSGPCLRLYDGTAYVHTHNLATL